jgi:hypothetical protein
MEKATHAWPFFVAVFDRRGRGARWVGRPRKPDDRQKSVRNVAFHCGFGRGFKL